MNSTRIAILASGQGTTTEAFIRASVADKSDISVVLVICNTKSAGIFQRIASLNTELNLNIQTVLINSHTHPATTDELVEPGGQTAAEQKAILEAFNQHDIDFVTLMGYLKRVGSQIVKAWGWQPKYTSIYQARMVNTHPGLLPETQGMSGANTQAFVLANNLPFGGQTLHVVSQDYDEGPIIAEHKVAVLPNDTPDSLFARVQAVEKNYIFKDISKFINTQKGELWNQKY